MCIGRKLDKVLQNLIPLAEQGKTTRFLNSTEDLDKLGGLVEDIHDAMMDYQVCVIICILVMSDVCVRHHCNKLSTSRVVCSL